MVNRAENLISEIKQIKSQYVKEVGRGRRVWPRSIKDRVAELDSLGVSARIVATETGIPYETVTLWRHKRRKAGVVFHSVAVLPEAVPSISKAATVTVAKSEMSDEIPQRQQR